MKTAKLVESCVAYGTTEMTWRCDEGMMHTAPAVVFNPETEPLVILFGSIQEIEKFARHLLFNLAEYQIKKDL